MGILYELHSDGCYYPKVTVPEQEPAHYGRYGLLHKQYLKEHLPLAYDTLLACGELVARLNQIDDIAQARYELLVEQMKEKQGITEEIKAKDPMAWVSAMNNIHSCVDEIILTEVVYE
ncbi:MAG: TnpV protein [Clostridiales bacterium]|nr:TnpV protein [Clostridiales bacterium]